MLTICLEHKSSLVSAIEIANDRQGGAGITITYQDWTNAENLHRILEPFKEATEALEGDYITLPLVPCIMSVLNNHIESEIAAFTPDSSLANATEVMLIDHSDRWDEIANVVKIAAALSARTKGLEWLDATEKALWRRSVIFECRKLFRADIAEEVPAGSTPNGPGSLDERGVGGGEPPRKKKKKGFLKRCVATAKAVGGGDEEEDEESEGGVGGAGGSSGSTYTPPPLSLEARIQGAEQELQRSTLERGIDDDDDDNESTGQDDLGWWSRHQFAYPTLARLAKKYLAIPASSAASERVFSSAGNFVTKKRNRLGYDTVDALVFLNGSHGLAVSSGLSQESLGRKDK